MLDMTSSSCVLATLRILLVSGLGLLCRLFCIGVRWYTIETVRGILNLIVPLYNPEEDQQCIYRDVKQVNANDTLYAIHNIRKSKIILRHD